MVDRPRPTWPLPVVAIAVGAGIVFLLFWGLGASGIRLWDESRTAVNTLEMSQRGFGLVTTYEGQADHWNTKPALLIWLTTALFQAGGPSELALRLPSAIAALLTFVITGWFVLRITRSGWWALVAPALLAGSLVFIGPHAAASGDYDALLGLFTTAYVALLFVSIHRVRPPATVLVLAALCIAGAVLTKSSAGLIPIAGVLAYVVLVRRVGRIASPRYVGAGVLAAAPVAAYYGLREVSDPGYLSAVSHNEVVGRYVSGIGDHGRSVIAFVLDLAPVRFLAAALLALIPFGLIAGRWRTMIGLVYATTVAVVMLSIYSLGATRLPWYAVPAMPWLCIAGTLAARSVIAALERRGRANAHRILQVAVVAVAAVSLLGGIAYRLVLLPRSEAGDPSYGAVFAALADAGVPHVVVIDDGVPNSEGLAQYTPQLRYYALVWAGRGVTVDRAGSLAELAPQGVAASCDPERVTELRSLAGSDMLVDTGTCLAVRLRSRA